ncbi:MAG: MFS transporter [Dehalococcoidia bacterium]|nr:MFS transporter [Dehalococcoidia bacterium]
MSTPRETDTQQQQLEQTHRAVTSPLGSLAVPNFRNYWFSAVSFVMGWQILRVLIAWEGYELTDSELFLGYLGGVMGIATISVNLIGGVAADRVSRLALLITTQVCATITVTVLMMLTFGEILAPWHLLAASAAIGIIQGIDQPTRTAVVPALIPDRRLLMNALAFSSSIWQGTRVFGPGLGGFLIERIGSAATFGTVTVGYGLGTLLLFFVRIPRVERVPGNVFKELFEGITFIARRNLFASLILLTFVDSFFGVAYFQLMPVFARDILGGGVTEMGWLLSASAAGGLIGTGLAAFWVKGRWPLIILLGCAGLFGVMVMIFAFSELLWLSLGALFLSGTFNSLSQITNLTLLQSAVPEELRGRVMGVFSMTYSLIPLGGLQVGALAEWLGAPMAVGIGGGVAVVFAIVLALRTSFARDVRAAARTADG